MGIAGLRKILRPSPIDLGVLRGRTVAVDANNMLWTFVTGLGARGDPPTDDAGEPTSHLIGLTSRLQFFAENGIRSAWVFDGEQPALKEKTLAERWARIEKAKADGDVRGALHLKREEIEECKELLSALGVPWLAAPGEADAQAAHFARTDAVWAAVTQDYDAALHGSPRTARNLSATGREPELMDLFGALHGTGLDQAKLVDVALLMGTDYNDGIKGVGPVKALRLIQEHGDVFGALDALGAEMPEAEAVRTLFLAHPVDEAFELRFETPDPKAVRGLLEARSLSPGRARTLSSALAMLHG